MECGIVDELLRILEEDNVFNELEEDVLPNLDHLDGLDRLLANRDYLDQQEVNCLDLDLPSPDEAAAEQNEIQSITIPIPHQNVVQGGQEASEILVSDLMISDSEEERDDDINIELPSEDLVQKIAKEFTEKVPTTDRLLECLLRYSVRKNICETIKNYEDRGMLRNMNCFKTKIRYVLRYQPY